MISVILKKKTVKKKVGKTELAIDGVSIICRHFFLLVYRLLDSAFNSSNFFSVTLLFFYFDFASPHFFASLIIHRLS